MIFDDLECLLEKGWRGVFVGERVCGRSIGNGFFPTRSKSEDSQLSNSFVKD